MSFVVCRNLLFSVAKVRRKSQCIVNIFFQITPPNPAKSSKMHEKFWFSAF